MITSNPPITGRNILISICQALIPQVILCKTIKSDSLSVYYLSIAHGSEHETNQIWVSVVPRWLASIHSFPVIDSTALKVVGCGGTGIYRSWSGKDKQHYTLNPMGSTRDTAVRQLCWNGFCGFQDKSLMLHFCRQRWSAFKNWFHGLAFDNKQRIYLIPHKYTVSKAKHFQLIEKPFTYFWISIPWRGTGTQQGWFYAYFLKNQGL